ncbi:MAG: hypothetical protein SV686_04720 [Thermodesulfobacteriota bacterium]|nr:hypothetical protein [Thermodesulfobacteriota bacterium]
MNSYYLNMPRLFEHYQGELGSGCVYFKSVTAEGTIFFDKDELLNGSYRDYDGEIIGKDAIDGFMKTVDHKSCVVTVYKIDPESIYFWANLPRSERIYNDLSTEFTDLQGLMSKMGSEKLTGFIEVSIENSEDCGLIFLSGGRITGGSFSWGTGKMNHSEESLQILLEKTKVSGGTFHVSSIPMEEETPESDSKKNGWQYSSDTVRYLEELLNIFEKTVKSNKRIKTEFSILLKKKFMDLANKYDFLDPFAAEVEYSGQRLTFKGKATEEELANGITESVRILADELEIRHQLNDNLGAWSKQHSDDLARFGIEFK